MWDCWVMWLTGVKWYFLVFKVCISLMINNLEPLSIYQLAIHMSSLEKYPCKSFPHFLIGQFCLFVSIFCLLLSCYLCIVGINSLSDIWVAIIFSHSKKLHFLSVDHNLCCVKAFQFDVVYVCPFLLLLPMLLVI